MHIVAHATLVAFYSQPRYQDSKGVLEAWYDVVRLAKWTSPADVKDQFRNAGFVGSNRVVFNIKGNDYRLIVAMAYRMQWAYIKFVGTHAQYDAIDAATVGPVQVKGIIMEVRAIRSEADYRAALALVSKLVDLDPAPDTAEGERLEVIGTLVRAYEAQHYPISPPDPIEAIKLRMEQDGLSVADMVPYIGPRHRVYEVLNGKRPLTMHMIRRLLTLGIPATSLVGKPEPVAA